MWHRPCAVYMIDGCQAYMINAKIINSCAIWDIWSKFQHCKYFHSTKKKIDISSLVSIISHNSIHCKSVHFNHYKHTVPASKFKVETLNDFGIWGSHNGGYDELYLLGSNTMWSNESQPSPASCLSMLVSCSLYSWTLKMEVTFLQNTGWFLINHSVISQITELIKIILCKRIKCQGHMNDIKR